MPSLLDPQAWPHWASELNRALAFQSQFVIFGNIRDQFTIPTEAGPVAQEMLEVIWELASQRGYQFMLVYDPIDGVRVVPNDRDHRDAAAAASRPPNLPALAFGKDDGIARPALKDLPAYLRALASNNQAAGLFVIDYASRLSMTPQELSEGHKDFFAACEKLAHQTRQVRAPGSNSAPPFNPILWLVNRVNDLPDWFIVGNETVRTLLAALPDRAARQVAAAALAHDFKDYESLTAQRRAKLVEQYALLTDGLTLRSLDSIAQLARDRDFGIERIADAIRAYKVGAPDDPWKDPTVRKSIRNGEEQIRSRGFKGQQLALRASLDILTRSAMGLTGAHANRAGNRPRGVLFFAGPTGVGKTELAKALTEVLFGDEGAYHRFDMSEFSAEHAEARLIGAPPGYLGHDAGGELVNAVRTRPFCLLLFDEIEKAHPRILDKFLQILEDGRLTDGRGETVFFSEAVIVFTSNLGISVDGPTGEKVQQVSPGDAYETVRTKVLEAIKDHFRIKLQRPELLNRIGDNIIVFNFIEDEVAKDLFDSMRENVLRRLEEEHSIHLRFEPEAIESLEAYCLGVRGSDADPRRLEDGGRGIGNRLESAFTNPLARALFDRELRPGETLTVQRLVENGGTWSLSLA